MDKMRMESADITDQNIEKIGALFPNCITEAKSENGKLTKAINFELLKQELSKEVIGGDEAYEFTWVGKKAAIVEANKPIRKTLRPCKEESVNWDTTENLYIEGDNLEVLKLLQESYLGKVKMIYIDPPYNTGNDFIYEDDFAQSREEYDKESGTMDENGDRMFKNTDSNGRFHSDWCSMIYSRLLLARNLLTDDGVIFISIDNNEMANLKKICDDVFGAENHISTFVWHNNKKGRQMDKFIKTTNEYVLMFAKKINCIKILDHKIKADLSKYPFKDEISNYAKGYPLHNGTAAFHINNRPNLCYSIYINKNGEDIVIVDEKIKTEAGYKLTISPQGEDLLRKGWIRVIPKKNEKYGTQRVWRWGAEKFLKEYKNELILTAEDGGYYYYQKDRVNENGEAIQKFTNYIEIDTSRGKKELNELFNNKQFFDFPKPVDLLQHLLKIASDKDSFILDFFSGSATTAHAVMQLNAEDGGNRKFIMVQLPEKCDEKSEAYKAGYKNICEIGKERIRRAAKKIHEEHPDVKFDDGFRVLKIDESNMTDVFYSPNAYSQDMLTQLESNIKPDRTDLDLLFGCLSEWGLPLSMPYTSEDIEGCTVHTYNDGDLIACFNENISESVIKEIAKRKPLRAVFRDSSFKGSPEKINVGETFKLLSPDTRVKII